MATFTTLPSVLYDCLSSYLSSKCILDVASTTREVRAHFLKALSKREPVTLLSGRVTHERIGPYIGKVAVAVDAEMEDVLYDLLRRICRLGALESLTVGEEVLMLGGCRRPPFEDWEWLSVVTGALRGGRRRLSRLSEVRLNCFFGGKTVGYRLTSANDDEEDEEEDEVAEFQIPPASSLILSDFISALPPSVTKLHLGPESSFFGVHHSGLSPKAEAALFQLLKKGALPKLTELSVPVHLLEDAFDGLVSALSEGPFASTLERLTLADGTGCRHHHCASNYAGPTDLTPLLKALRNCPNLRSLTLGRGRCEAKHWYSFMDLVLEGPLSLFDRVPTPTDLPVAFATLDEMEAALSMVREALVRGRFKATKVLTLGADTSHLPLPSAALEELLLATRTVDLPCLSTLVLAARFEMRTLAMLATWVAQRPSLTRMFVHCVGPAIPPRGEKEDLVIRLIEHFAATPGMEVLELAWEMEAVKDEEGNSMQMHEGQEGHEEEEEKGLCHASEPPLPGVEGPKRPRCCMLNYLHDLLRRCRRPKSGHVIDVAFVTTAMPEEGQTADLGSEGICNTKRRTRIVVSMRRIEEAELCWTDKLEDEEFIMPYMPRWEAWLCHGGKGDESLTDYRLVLRECGTVESITVSLRLAPKPGPPNANNIEDEDEEDEDDDEIDLALSDVEEDEEENDEEDDDEDDDESDMDSFTDDEAECDCCDCC